MPTTYAEIFYVVDQASRLRQGLVGDPSEPVHEAIAFCGGCKRSITVRDFHNAVTRYTERRDAGIDVENDIFLCAPCLTREPS